MLRRDFLKAGTGVVVAGSALAGLAACGPRKGPSDTINIVSTSGTTSLVLTALMEDVGYLGEFGVKSNFINVADGNKVAAALISGHADLCPSAPRCWRRSDAVRRCDWSAAARSRTSTACSAASPGSGR